MTVYGVELVATSPRTVAIVRGDETVVGPRWSTLRTFEILLFFNEPAPPEVYTLSLHDALPISLPGRAADSPGTGCAARQVPGLRSEEHTSELQSPYDLVCRLLLEKKQYPDISSTASQKRRHLAASSSPSRPTAHDP